MTSSSISNLKSQENHSFLLYFYYTLSFSLSVSLTLSLSLYLSISLSLSLSLSLSHYTSLTHRSLIAHEDSVTCVRFQPETHYFFSSGKDGVLKYWDADRSVCVCAIISPFIEYDMFYFEFIHQLMAVCLSVCLFVCLFASLMGVVSSLMIT